MRALKWIAVAAGALLVLLVVGLLLILLLVDPNAYRGRLQDVVRARTGRELALQGDLKLSVFPWLAIELGPATLGNAPGFDRAPMLAIRHARLGLKLWPLLHGRFEVGSVRLDGPAVRLEVDGRGRNNWSDLLQRQAPATAEQGPRRFEGSIAGIAVEDGSLVYVDHRAGTTRKLEQLRLRSGRMEAGQAFPLQLQAVLTPDPKSRIELKLDTRARIDTAAGRYGFEAPALALRLVGKKWPQSALPVTLRFASVVADLGAQTLAADGLHLEVAGAHVRGELRGTKILDAPRITGPVALADVAPRALLAGIGVAVPATRDPRVLQHLRLEGSLDATPQALGVNGLKGKLDDTAFNGRLRAGFDGGALELDLQADRIDVDRYLAPAAPRPATAGKGAATSAPPIAIPVAPIRGLEMKGELRVGSARLAGIEYSKLHFGLNAHAGRIRIHPSEAQMYGGQYRGDIGLDVSGATPRASFDEHVSGADFAALFRDLFDSRRFSGRGSASAKLGASGPDTAAMLRTLSGDVAFDVQDGAFEGVDLWYEIRRARALLKRQAPPERSGPARTPFTVLHATGKVDRGILSNDDLTATTAYLRVRGRGTIDIAAATLDYRLEVEVPRTIGALDRDAGDAADLAGLTIPVRVSGALAEPKVRPDLEGLAKAEVKRQVEKKKGEVEEKLKEKLKGKLKGLLGG
jgi:AsmA protein